MMVYCLQSIYFFLFGKKATLKKGEKEIKTWI